jgi:uncharacterized Ntn-hydrolase superfamily protein
VTYSIVARDPATGDLGVAVQSKFLAVGAVVPWARAGVGAIATQAYANVAYGPDGLALLADGLGAKETLQRLVTSDDMGEERQAGIVDARGGVATHTGGGCMAWAGGRLGEGFAAQGNIVAGPAVVDALADTFLAGDLPFPELLIACLAAADAVGGDRRGRESAALLTVREGGGFGAMTDRWFDLRVDAHHDPIGELSRLVDLHRLYLDPPEPADLLALDEALVGEIQVCLTSIGGGPGGRFENFYVPMSGPADTDESSRPVVGEPRPLPPNWDSRWQQALDDWLDVENLEARTAAPGWIDPRVLSILRSRRSS